ncbi:hypothetical protein [Chryseobacterium sp. RLHN22]|uniref:hypothetical protein n=1 Tax=Chryseobacterium sp. RLHN22 TaxID=3437885 RepID=UPI003D9AFCB4
MKNIILLSVVIFMQLFADSHKVDVWKTIIITPNESIAIDKVKAPAILEIKNLSSEKITLTSDLNIPNEISGKSELKYRLPKKRELKDREQKCSSGFNIFTLLFFKKYIS